MPVYLNVHGDITDDARTLAGAPLIARRPPRRHFEFPQMDAIRALWTSAEYQPVKELRAVQATWTFGRLRASRIRASYQRRYQRNA
jgi:hypothetical protein